MVSCRLELLLGCVLAFPSLAVEAPSSCSSCDEDKVNLLHLKNQESQRRRDDEVAYKVSPANAYTNSLLKKKVKVTLALNGGGNPGMATHTGVYRALHRMDLLEKIDQISDGNGYVTAPLLYAKDRSLEDLLGTPTEPGNLTLSELNSPNGELLQVSTKPIGPTIFAFSLVPEAALPTRELYAAVIANQYLCPFGLNGELPPPLKVPSGLFPVPGVCTNLNEDQVWALDEDHLQRMASENPHLDFQSNLTTQRLNVKSFVLSGRAFSPAGYWPTPGGRPLFWLSPDQCGIPFYTYDQNFEFVAINESVPNLEHLVVGGGVVDSVACLSTEAPGGLQQAGKSKRAYSRLAQDTSPLTLATAVGISSNGFDQTFLDGNPVAIQTVQALFSVAGRTLDPEDPLPVSIVRPHWPVAAKKRGDISKRDWYIAGLPSQSAVGLSRAILSGASCHIGVISFTLEVPAVPSSGLPALPAILEFLDCSTRTVTNQTKFLEYRERGSPDVLIWGEPTGTFGSGSVPPDPNNFTSTYFQLFAPDSYVPLLCQFQENFDNKGVAYASVELTTVKNDFFGIKAGRKIHALFLSTARTPKFEELLPDETAAAIEAGSFTNGATGINGWPYIDSVNPNPADPSAITAEQANLLAAQFEWTTLQIKDELEACIAKGEPTKTKRAGGYYGRHGYYGHKRGVGWWGRR